MFKRFFKDSAIYVVGTVLSQGIGLILLPLYTHIFAPADYGLIDILTITAKLVNLVVALEISQGVARLYPEVQTDHAKAGYASTALWFTLLMYTLFAGLAMGLSAPLSAWILESSAQQNIFRVAVLSMSAEGIFYLIQNQLRFRLQPVLYAIVSIVAILVSVAIIVSLLLGTGLGVIGVFYGQLAGALAGAGLGLYFARRDYTLVFDWAKCKEMLTFSIPLVPSSMAVFVVLYIDRIVVKMLMSMTDLGLLGVSYRIASIVMLLMMGFQSALTPLIYTHYRAANAPQELARIFRVFVFSALLLFMGLSLFASEILAILTTPDYYTAALLLPLLTPAILLYRMYVFAPGLAIAKKTGLIGAINALTAILNTALNLAWVPKLGIQGAILATLVSAALAFGIHLIYSQRLYFVPHAWRGLAAASAVAVGVVLIGLQVQLVWWINLIIKGALISLAAGVFVGLGLVKIAEMQSLWLLLTRYRPVTGMGFSGYGDVKEKP
jgi:O-antigen/teichoic acid export membrane protein